MQRERQSLLFGDFVQQLTDQSSQFPVVGSFFGRQDFPGNPGQHILQKGAVVAVAVYIRMMRTK